MVVGRPLSEEGTSSAPRAVSPIGHRTRAIMSTATGRPSWTAAALAKRIARRELRSVEALDAFLLSAEERNADLNALVTLDEEVARKRAGDADRALGGGTSAGPLHGVPITVKDCWETAGLRTTCGFPGFDEYVPREDATCVARLREAGAVVLGKTNPAMLAADWQTDNPVFGRTDHPEDPSLTPGGSSGGAAAAVSAGLSPLDLASDLGGSIRVPAHFCGVCGLKPTEHRVPSRGHIPDWHLPGREPDGLLRHMGTYGPIARSVADLRLCFSVIAGPDSREPEVAPLPVETDAAVPALDSLEVAWSTRFGPAPVSGETELLIAELATALDDAGCRVERIRPRLDFERIWRTWGEIAAAELRAGMPLRLRSLLLARFLSMSDRSAAPRKGLLRGLGMGRVGHARALSRRDRTVRDVDRVLAGRDAWLCPVSATPAFPHAKPGASISVDGAEVPYVIATAAYTTPFNLSGHPVVVLPMGRSGDGLPIGVQVVGHRWADERLLDVAEALEELTPLT